MKTHPILSLLLVFVFSAGFFPVSSNASYAPICSGSIDLCGGHEVPPVVTEGIGKFEYELYGNGSMRYSLSARDLESGVTQAHIHIATCGANGSVVAFLFGPFNEGVHADGLLVEDILSDNDLIGPLAGMSLDDLCSEFAAGNAYINVHTVAHPPGEIRGQIGNDGCYTCPPYDPPVPSLSQWGLMILGLVLTTVGIVAVRQRLTKLSSS